MGTFLAPLFALQVSAWLERRREKQRQRFAVFQTLMQWRKMTFVEQPVRALIAIGTVFNDVRSVRDAWSDLFRHIATKGYKHPKRHEYGRTSSSRCRRSWRTISATTAISPRPTLKGSTIRSRSNGTTRFCLSSSGRLLRPCFRSRHLHRRRTRNVSLASLVRSLCGRRQDTAKHAVNPIRTWLDRMGRPYVQPYLPGLAVAPCETTLRSQSSV